MSSPPLHSSHLFTNFVVGISFLPEKYFFKWSRFCQEWHRLYPVLASVSVMMPFLSLSLAHHWCDEKAICFFSSPWPHTTLHALVRFFFFIIIIIWFFLRKFIRLKESIPYYASTTHTMLALWHLLPTAAYGERVNACTRIRYRTEYKNGKKKTKIVKLNYKHKSQREPCRDRRANEKKKKTTTVIHWCYDVVVAWICLDLRDVMQKKMRIGEIFNNRKIINK